MIITIFGAPGAGKTTVAKALAKKLGYEHFSGGDFRGRMALKHGMTIDELDKIGAKEIWTDKECDDLIAEMGRTKDNLVIDSWTAWHFIPKSVKIYLDVDPQVAAERVSKNQRPDEPKQKTVEGVKKMLADRFKETAARYKKWYNIDISDRKNYELIIDTSKLDVDATVGRILDFVKKKGKL
jgi:cytidylate kinase